MQNAAEITLRDYRDSDVEHLVALADNEKVSRYLVDTFPYPYSEADARWWIATGCREGGAVTRVIEWNGEFAGSVGLVPQTGWRDHIAEIGYWLGEPFWGKGIATSAVAKMTSQAFSDHPFTKLMAPVFSPNSASMRVLERNGYVLEGILKGEVAKNGRVFDLHHYATYRPT